MHAYPGRQDKPRRVDSMPKITVPDIYKKAQLLQHADEPAYVITALRAAVLIVIAALGFSGVAFGGSQDAEILKQDPTRSYGSIDVILYETSWCPWCVKSRELLKELGVSLVEYDIEKEPERNTEMKAKNGGRRGVPVIDVEGTIIPGYDADAIKTAIELKRRK